MDKKIFNIYNSLQEIAWHLGNQGIIEECCKDLSLVEFMALKKAHENKYFSIQEIGSAISFTKSGATRIVDRLVNKGYVERARSSADGRICCVYITGKGKEVLDKVIHRYTSNFAEMLKGIEPQTVKDLEHSLDVLLRIVRKHEIS
jgi:DNA-binding MarR family transcriptional regulator